MYRQSAAPLSFNNNGEKLQEIQDASQREGLVGRRCASRSRLYDACNASDYKFNTSASLFGFNDRGFLSDTDTLKILTSPLHLIQRFHKR